MRKILLLVFPVIVVIGGLIIWSRSNTNTTQPQQDQQSTTQQQPVSNTSEMRVESNSIYVSGQGESSDLTVTMVTITEPGFVVIHADSNGQPGEVLGSSTLLQSGSHNNTPIKLSRKTVNGEIIYAVLHKDNGDGQYTSTDETVKGSNGEAMYMTVTVDKDAQSSSGDVSL